MINENVKSNEFINCSTPNHAYILGLLWADGHVTFSNNNAMTPIIKHTTKEDDFKEFKEIIQKTGNWKYFHTKNIGSFTKKENNMYINWTSNRKLGNFLIKNDYRCKNKSPFNILNKLNEINKQLWFRGYFDGDGSITVIPKGHHSITFTGPKNQNWEFIIDLYKKLNINNYKYRVISSRGGQSSQIRLSNKKEMLLLYFYLYKNYPKIGLTRKKEKFELL